MRSHYRACCTRHVAHRICAHHAAAQAWLERQISDAATLAQLDEEAQAEWRAQAGTKHSPAITELGVGADAGDSAVISAAVVAACLAEHRQSYASGRRLCAIQDGGARS